MLKTLTLINDETISTTTSTKVVKVFERNFAYQITWENGSSVDFNIEIQVSLDKTNWVSVTPLITNITDTSGSVYNDSVTSAQYIKITLTRTGGSADFTVLMRGNLQETI